MYGLCCPVIHLIDFSIGRQAALFFFFFQAEDGIRALIVTGVQTCALPIYPSRRSLGADADLRHAGTWYAGGGRRRCRFRDAAAAGSGGLVGGPAADAARGRG